MKKTIIKSYFKMLLKFKVNILSRNTIVSRAKFT